ncbi:hypothetical protein DN523_01575 [Burkholderia multivorans]|uniref:Uncharacterized protein n=1 Tax=Burkholderia multivorans TaxID=87883 RepID=A0AB37ARA4_9BURK|nr:hypothetical protein EGY20_04905 [Burkholderia multivorans]PRE44714.1 hypothetical protein C6P97_21365 [Burkholderia multivorans]PRE46694.1 hypothetical protein C6P99_17225 [Burkholderia multivorans]PRH04290.1 hypothetical protein C6T61_20285 [Burkholderia multivorans]RAA24910.1 hypothetical protein DN470_16485 [Burkholderia multivorans]
MHENVRASAGANLASSGPCRFCGIGASYRLADRTPAHACRDPPPSHRPYQENTRCLTAPIRNRAP